MKTLYSGILFCLIMQQSLCQTTIYPRVGISYSTNTWKQAGYDIGYRTSLTAGAGIKVKINSLHLISEVNYTGRGHTTKTELKTTNNRLVSKQKHEHTYIVVPVLLGANLRLNSTVVYGNIGPYVGCGMGGKYIRETTHYSQGALVGSGGSEGDIKYGNEPVETDMYYHKRFDYGATFGIGGIFLDRIGMDARYSLGLVDLFENANYKNRAIEFTVFVPISLDRRD